MNFPRLSLRRPLASAALALVATSAAAQAPVNTQAATEARHFLWEVVSMTNRGFLFGTIHAGKKEMYPLDAAIEQAFADSDVLVVEADITDKAAMETNMSGMSYTPPDELSKHVAPADYKRFQMLLGKYGVPEWSMKSLKPFTAVSLLMFSEWARQGYDPGLGIDAYLIGKAKAAKKPIVELEGVAEQAKLVDSLTEQEHATIFSGTVTALESGLTGEQIEGLVKAWQVGDSFLMLEIARRYNEKVPGARELEEKFIWSRHTAMLEKIEGYLNKSNKRHFIAVGSLHMSGPRGLVALLRAKGYIVRQR